MPTLEELFKSKKLPSLGDKTAEEAYAIRNSKDIRISSADPFINTVGMSLSRLARKNLGARGSETLLEEEVTGIRIIRTTSMPFIYGTELPRLTLRSTTLLDTMRGDTNGDIGGGGALGNLISGARDKILNSKFLGIPQAIIPTKVKSDSRITENLRGQIQKNYLDTLETVRKEGEGKPLGKFLKGLSGGDPKTIGKQAIGNAISEGKSALREKLFGGAGKTGFNSADINGLKNTTINYGNISNSLGVTIGPPNNDGVIDAQGLMYSKTFNLVEPLANSLQKQNYEQQYGRSEPGLSNKIQFVDITDEGGMGGRFSKALEKLNYPENILFSENPNRDGKVFSSKISKPISKDDFIEKKRGMGQILDTINNTNIFEGETLTLGDGTTLDEKDFVPLKFTSIHRNKTVQFRATITGLTESFTPSWDSHKFIGSPFNNYTYSSIERTVSFNFKVYSLNALEHKVGWDKINFLNSLVLPQGYYSSSAVVPPFIKFTLGDLYSSQIAFIESLTHTWDDTHPWNVSDKEQSVISNVAGLVTGNTNNDIDMKGYRLPMITDVGLTLKFLINRNTTEGRKFYSFNPQTN